MDDVGAGVRTGVVVDDVGLFAQRVRAPAPTHVGIIQRRPVAHVIRILRVVFCLRILLASGGHVAVVQIRETLHTHTHTHKHFRKETKKLKDEKRERYQ